jgi:preprotein translocase subunit SecD
MEPILAGTGQISGGFDMNEAKNISDRLMTGECVGV